MKDFASSLLRLWRELGLNQRVSLVIAFIGVLGAMTALLVWSSRPDYQLLYGRLSQKDASSIVALLDERGTPHRIGAGGDAIYVPSSEVHTMRMELAGKGLPAGDGVGFEIFDRGQFGLSDFVQRTNYNRALQGELARTIAQLDGVRHARVLIVQPESRLLLTNQTLKPTASVFVERDHTSIDASAVNSIRHLVANAVQGLLPDEVAVVDQAGQVLSAELKEDPMLGSASSMIRYRQQVEDYLARKVESMLLPVLGPGQAIVRVSADIDVDAVQSTEERFDPDSAVVRSEVRTTDDTNTAEARRGGLVGAAGNTPDQPEVAAGSPLVTNAQNRTNQTVSYEINRVVSNVTRNPGSIRSVTAAVFVAARPPAADGTPAAPRTVQEIESLREIVITALGLSSQNGRTAAEQVSLQEMPFQPVEIADEIVQLQQETRIQSWVEVALRYVSVGIALLVLLVFFRLLRRQRVEALPVEMILAQAEASGSRAAAPNELTPEMLNDLIRQKPANVGTALRDWVGEGKN
jgi:flagellar M-ring protein FliF